MKDGVFPIEFQGATAWRIVWKGCEIPMYWGKEREAREHLWMLRNPDAARAILERKSIGALNFERWRSREVAG